MKKAISLLLALALCLSLTACGKSEAVKSVEDLIDGIGNVTISSSAKINEAEEAYNSLSTEEQGQVKNYKNLEKARQAFNALGIPLTLANYAKYLNVSFSPQLVDATDYGRMIGVNVDTGSYVYSGIETSVYVSGKSENYDYNDVIVTVKCSGFYVPHSAEIIKKSNKGELDLEKYFLENANDIDFSLTATTDIVGNGSDSHTIEMPDGYWVMSSAVDLSCEVVDISGILTK